MDDKSKQQEAAAVLNMSSPRPCPPPRNQQQRSCFLLLKLSVGGGLQQEAASGVMLSPSSLLPQSNQKAQHILLQRWGKRSGSNMRRCPPRFDHSGGHRFRLLIRLSLSLFPFLSSMFSPWVRISVDMAVSGILTAANPASPPSGNIGAAAVRFSVQVGGRAKALPIILRSLSPRSGHRHGMAVRWHLPHCAAAAIRHAALQQCAAARQSIGR